MRAFVKYTSDVDRIQLAILVTNSIHFLVLGVYLIGHLHRGLCADVPGLCRPFPVASVWMLALMLPSVLSVPMFYCAAFGVNTAYLAATMAVAFADMATVIPLILIRSLANTSEDTSFHTFALATSWALLIVSVTKVILILIYNGVYTKWYTRALQAIKLVLKSEFMLKQLGLIRMRMNSTRQIFSTLVWISVLLVVLYGFGSFLFVWSFNAASLMASRTFFLLQILSLPRYYVWAIYLACAGFSDLSDQTKEYGFVQLSYTTVMFLQLVSIPHAVLSATATFIHFHFLLSSLDDLFVFEAVWAGILASLAALFLLTDIIGLFASSYYLSLIVRLLRKDIPLRFKGKLPAFPLEISGRDDIDWEEEEDEEVEVAEFQESAARYTNPGTFMDPLSTAMSRTWGHEPLRHRKNN